MNDSSSSSEPATAPLIRLYSDELPAIGRTCTALLGTRAEVSAALTNIRTRLESEADTAEGTRAALFSFVRQECAHRAERKPRRHAAGQDDDTDSVAEDREAAAGRAILASLYPSEREALALYAVAELSLEELAQALDTDASSARERLSRAVTNALAGVARGPERPIQPAPSDRCAEVDSNFATILEGSAEETLYQHLSKCERCRDRRHEAENLLRTVALSGNDAVPAQPEGPARPEKLAAQPEVPLPPEKPAVQPVARRAPERSRSGRGWIVGGALALAGALLIGQRLSRSSEEPTRPTMTEVRVERVLGSGNQGGLAACAPSGSPCQSLAAGDRVPAGSRVKTDFATQASLRIGTKRTITIERGGEVALAATSLDAELLRGSFVAEADDAVHPIRFAVAQGSIRAARAKLAIHVGREDTLIEVLRGHVEVRDSAGETAVVRAGEQTRLGDGPPLAVATPMVGSGIAWSDRFHAGGRDEVGTRGLGELVAKKPGTERELDGAVRLAEHRVRVRIAGPIARTEIEEVFTNTTSDVLEGIYRFPLPPDAKIERLALEVDGKLMEGAFVERDRAAAIWRGAIVNTAPQARPLMREEIVWVPGPWRDPALLEWQRGGRFELRIFPIPKHGSRRIVLAYTEVVRPTGGTRRYSYALAHDPSGSTEIDRFEMDVQVRGHDPRFRVRTSGYELTPRETADTQAFGLTRERFRPTGDLSIEYALPNRDAELSAWTYQHASTTVSSSPATAKTRDERPFVALALRPALPSTREAMHRDFAVVVDSSRSMYGESFTRAKRVAARIAKELDPEDRVVLLACDSECQRWPEGLMTPGEDAERATARFLDTMTPDGASDPTRAQIVAYEALGTTPGREARIVFIGDGAPTMGPIRPDHMEAIVGRSLPKNRARVTAVAIGNDSDLESLAAIARGGGGVALPYAAGQSVAETVYDILGAAYGHALRDVTVQLPEGLVDSAPARLDAIPAGAETLVVARMTQPHVAGDVVIRGELAGERFERRYPVRFTASDARGNSFVPRLYAALKIADLERSGTDEARVTALTLSRDYNVASRYTSLLVLESEAMFTAFGLENRRVAPEWSGEEDVEGVFAEEELALSDAAAESMAGGLADGRASSTLGAAPRAAPAPARARAAAPLESGDAFPGAAEAKRKGEAPAFAPEPEEPRRRMVPMRRVWERTGTVSTTRSVPQKATAEAIATAESQAARDVNRRELTRQLHALVAAASDLDRAEQVVERWLERDPLDVEALTARADLAARRGDRAKAIRLLGSVIDVRPGDIGAQRRLERLHRWAGRAAIGCRHLVSAAELRGTDAALLADAVRCSRDVSELDSAERLLNAAAADTRRKAEQALAARAIDDSTVRGDLRIEATWSGGSDLDLALLDADGARYSWLGAPTRAVISARDVSSRGREALGIRGAPPGEYVLEIVRAAGSGPVNGELTVHVAGTTRRVPFQLSGTRASLGIASIRMVSRLVPL